MAQIGILVPRSTIFPTINFDFVDGLKLSLAKMGVADAEIKTASIDVGGSDKEIYAVCEKLLFDGCEIIVGYINPVTAEMIQPLFENTNGLFILLSSGYHVPSPAYKQTSIFNISLDSTLACKLLPQYAASKGDNSFAYTCSFYDSGYRSAFGFFNSVKDCGSQIVYNHITKLLKQDFTIAPLTDFLKQNPSAAIMAAFCGDMTEDLFRSMEAEDEYTKHNIYGAPFVAEEVWLAKSPYPGNTINVVVPWGRNLTNPENEVFKTEMSKRKRTANLFSLLSWEAGIVIAKALEADETSDRIALLENFSYNSPRGKVTIDKETHNSFAPLYHGNIVENDADGMCSLVIDSEVNTGHVNEQRAKLEHDIATVTGSFTSWFNVYGCLD